MTWAMVAVAGASLVGGVMGANASKSAANAQAGAANNATQAQENMFNQQVGMEAPYRQAGLDATNRLSYLLGLSPTGYTDTSGGSTASANGGVETADQIRARLAPQFPISQSAVPSGSGWDPSMSGQAYGDSTQTTAGVNSTALDAAVQAELQRQQQAQQTAQQTAKTNAAGDPAYGSLLHNFGVQDFQLDPGIQFQTQQGNMALQNSQAAKDGVLSGAALKDLIGYNQGMAGTGYQSAYDRYMANKGFTMSALSGLSNTGQAAASNQATGGSSYASGIAGSMQGAGNAQAAGAIGGANALSGGITGASNAYLLRNMMNPASSPSTFTSSPMSGLLYSNGSLGD